MRKIFIFFPLLFSFTFSSYACSDESVIVVFWNLENFFDYTDEGAGNADKEFSSYGIRHWSKSKFYSKCDAVAKAFLWISERYGKMPDIIGLAEVENREVLFKLLKYTLLRKFDYKIIHYDSSDSRGIDVALMYRSSRFRKISVSLKVPEYRGEKLQTRDILQVCLEDDNGQRINAIVNHHPSKFGGEKASEGRRTAAMEALRELCDSLIAVDRDVPLIAMGDFNDSPDGNQFRMLDSVLVNKADTLFHDGKGTIRYEGKWDLIDMFLVSHELDSISSMEILQIPFLMTYEKKYPGLKPFRTYSGPRYIGGVSDHCPIVLCIFPAN